MKQETSGTVVSVAKMWWLKVNSKAVRKGTLDGATFPHVVKFSYTVDGKTYTKRAWIHAGVPVPKEGDAVSVEYDSDKPSKGKLGRYAGRGF